MMDDDLTKMSSITLVGKSHLYAMMLALKEKGFDVLICDTDSCTKIKGRNFDTISIDEFDHSGRAVKLHAERNRYIEPIAKEPKQKAQWKRELRNRR